MRIVALVLIAVAFFGGYHLGQKHQDSGMFEQVSGIYDRAAEFGSNLAGDDSPDDTTVRQQENSSDSPQKTTIEDKNASASTNQEMKTVTFRLGGKTYRVNTN